MSDHNSFIHKIDKSALVTIIGIILLFSTSIIVILIAPRYVDPSWTEPTNPYQVQMYEVSDPNLYISSAGIEGGLSERQAVYHLQENFSLLAFQETEFIRIIAPPNLEKFITRYGDKQLKLTSQLMLLRKPESTKNSGEFDALIAADSLKKSLLTEWEQKNADWQKEDRLKPTYEIYELYIPNGNTAFAVAPSDGIIENWVDANYTILDDSVKHAYHSDPGVIYINNPREYRISHFKSGNEEGWRYNPNGEAITDLQQLKSHQLGFRSRQELILMGEHIYAIEGCWYCHTDQTRTLIQDVVLNGSDSYPAPPSSANEYIYQRITFAGTRRIGPDLSRVGVKRPSRDWHIGHFWSPTTASRGTIMPPFQHFFDNDPRGSRRPGGIGIPNYQFEAVFQYMMTKGTRITPPTEAWWLGKDPIKTKEIIEGQRKLP